jgi:McrBC 5-methylcytosine restriction system component/AAA domain (dynein-related subfamily)
MASSMAGDYAHRRAVNWLWVDRDGIDASDVAKVGLVQRTIYEIDKSSLNVPALERYMNSQQDEGLSEPEPFVLIIDEINRANISKVFGELITLLEPDKRLGQPNQLKVRLPYSGDEFGVPSNLHIVGTMNTAGHALLFEMNALFEQYVARLVTRALPGSGYRVVAQGGYRDCLFEQGTGRFRTKPDLIIRQGERTALIIDTKWKRMAPRIDDPKQGVSKADVYQLMAYSQLYRCPNVMLLYPHHGDLPPDPICTLYAIASVSAAENLHIATLNVAGSSQTHIIALKRLLERSLPTHHVAS